MKQKYVLHLKPVDSSNKAVCTLNSHEQLNKVIGDSSQATITPKNS